MKKDIVNLKIFNSYSYNTGKYSIKQINGYLFNAEDKNNNNYDLVVCKPKEKMYWWVFNNKTKLVINDYVYKIRKDAVKHTINRFKQLNEDEIKIEETKVNKVLHNGLMI